MSRILLADDSPHAQRMGELILREEGYEVVTVTDGASVLVRLRDFDPDLILVDVAMPTKSGYEICEFVKSSLGHVHTRVVLLAGAQETVDEHEARRVHVDGVLKKPFEASLMLQTVKPLLEDAAAARVGQVPDLPSSAPVALGRSGTCPTDELVRAAVTIALDAVLPNLIDEITQKVLSVLDTKNA